MPYENIVYTREEGVATIMMSRPQTMNAYTHDMVREFLAALEDAQADDHVRVLVVGGAGRGFCSGADLSNFPPPPGEATPLASIADLWQGFHRLILRLHDFPKPSIAAINGPAVAGGLALALACDLRIASDRARLGDGNIRFGFVPSQGGVYFLPRVVGLSKAAELILMGDILDAEEALSVGLVNRVVAHEDLREQTREIASRLAQGPPIAQRLAKRALYRELSMDLESSLDDIALAAQIVNETEDAAEGARAFREGREPQFRGR